MNSNLKDQRILLIDPAFSAPAAKTWCYWNDSPLAIHPKKAIHSWSKISLTAAKDQIHGTMNGLNYYHLNSVDFYRSMNDLVDNNPKITKLEDHVTQIDESDGQVTVSTASGKKLTAGHVFDSRLNPEVDFKKSTLKQIFSGWRIETEEGVFDPESITLMDIKTDAGSKFDFFYILPYSSSSALVEYTAYSKTDISTDELNQCLRTYLAEKIGGKPYFISYEEQGIIPMTTQQFPTSSQSRVVPIGTRAGWTKASTGYTFHTIQKNCEKIVKNLESGVHPSNAISRSSRFRFYDNILLNIAAKWPNRLAGLFLDLFGKIPTPQVLRFLNEETSLWEEVKLLSKLRFPIFIQSLLRYEKH